MKIQVTLVAVREFDWSRDWLSDSMTDTDILQQVEKTTLDDIPLFLDDNKTRITVKVQIIER